MGVGGSAGVWISARAPFLGDIQVCIHPTNRMGGGSPLSQVRDTMPLR